MVNILPVVLCGGFNTVGAQHGNVLGQVVKQAAALLKEQWQVVFDPGGGNAAAHVLIDRAFSMVHIETLMPAAPEPRNTVVVQRKFAAGEQVDTRYLFQAALVLGVEAAQAVDLVVQQVEAVGQWAAHGEDVQHRAAKGVFAVLIDGVDVVIAAFFQVPSEIRQVELLPSRQLEAATVDVVGGGNTLH